MLQQVYPDCKAAKDLKARVENLALRHVIVRGGMHGLIGLGIAAIACAGRLTPLGLVGMGIAAIVGAWLGDCLPHVKVTNL